MYFPNNQGSYLLLLFVNAVLCLEVTSWVTTEIDIQAFAGFAAALVWVRRLVEMEWNIIRKFLKVKTENVLNIWSRVCFLFSCFHPFWFLSDRCLGIWLFLTQFVFEVLLSNYFRKFCMLWNLIFWKPQCLAGQILLVADNIIIGRVLVPSVFYTQMDTDLWPMNQFICCCYICSEMWLSTAKILSADSGTGISCLFPHCSLKVWQYCGVL